MTDIVYDRDFSTEETSSVIDHVYYSTADKLLFVQLVREDWNGNAILAGYENVPADVYTALELINSNRVSGASSDSVGSYWNIWIKPYFTGYNTADVELVSTEERDANEKLKSFLNQSSVFAEERVNVVPSTVFDKPEAEEVPVVEVGEAEFIVHWNEGMPGSESCVRIYAGSVDQALVIFNQIAKIAGWGAVNITAVTQIFN